MRRERAKSPASDEPDTPSSDGPTDILHRVGLEVRRCRRRRGLSRRALHERSGVSERFLAALEAGTGNISLRRLDDLARALDVPVSRFLQAPAKHSGHRLALLGLRGAGKSTIGPRVARHLKVRFVELDALIEETAGMPVGPIFELHGESYFRRLERDALRRLLAGDGAFILATGGGLVTDAETLSLLTEGCTTVWLSATPEDHYNRVLAQGDRRPMSNNPDAMAELRGLLAVREPLYRRADVTVDTSSLTVQEAVERISERLET